MAQTEQGFQRDYFYSPFLAPPNSLFAISCDESHILGIEIVRGQELLPARPPHPLAQRCFEQIEQYLHGERREINLPYRLQGTAFQCQLWQSLKKIPYGKTCSYKELAALLGRPQAYRAVGTACRANPLLLLLPCHRVVGAGGKLCGYAGGLEMKARLLQLESL